VLNSLWLLLSDAGLRLFIEMEVPCFAGSSSSSLVTKAGKKRKLEEEGAPAAGVPLTAKPWLDDGVNEGEDTEEMDLNELKEAFEDDEEEEQLSPKVTQVTHSLPSSAQSNAPAQG